eukprot:1700220-Pyramimonas_sp.AAC.1
MQFLAGASAAVGRVALFGTAWALVFVARSPSVLPLAKKPLKGVASIRPDLMRDPPPVEAIWSL